MLARFQKPVGLRRWLFYLSLAAMLPMLLFGGYAVLEFDRASRQAILADLEHRSGNLQRAAEQTINVAAASLNSMADSQSAQAGDWQALYDQARRAIARDGFLRAVTLVDSAGNVVFHTSTPFGTPLFRAHEMASVEAAMKFGRVSVSGAFTAPISPKAVVAVSVPLRQGSQLRYVLRAIVLRESIDRLMAEAALPDGWIAGVTDSRGTLLARSAKPDEFVGKPAAPSFFEAIRRGDGRPFQGTTLEGVRTTLVVLPVHGGDWYLGVAVPDSILHAPLDRSIQRIAVFAVLWLGLASVMSYAFGSYVILQAQALVEAASAKGTAAAAGTPLRIHEFIALLAEIAAARQREAVAAEQLMTARVQRDEVFDLYDSAPCGYYSLDRDMRLLRMNVTARGWLGYQWEELQGRPLTDLLTAESKVLFAECFPKFLQAGHIEDVELTLVRKDGSSFPVSINASAVKDADGTFIMTRSTVFDITERKRLEAQLKQLARTDPLTGLGNRRDFEEQAEREWQRRQRHDWPMAVLMLDIDHFKRINDQHGHDAGDAVLRQVARGCEAHLRNVDLLSRIGGEEFAVILPETPVDRALEVAHRLCHSLASLQVPLPDGHRVTFTVSIGLAMCDSADANLEATLKRADVALYEAKAGGRNQVRLASAAGGRQQAGSV